MKKYVHEYGSMIINISGQITEDSGNTAVFYVPVEVAYCPGDIGEKDSLQIYARSIMFGGEVVAEELGGVFKRSYTLYENCPFSEGEVEEILKIAEESAKQTFEFFYNVHKGSKRNEKRKTLG